MPAGAGGYGNDGGGSVGSVGEGSGCCGDGDGDGDDAVVVVGLGDGVGLEPPEVAEVWLDPVVLAPRWGRFDVCRACLAARRCCFTARSVGSRLTPSWSAVIPA